MSDLREPGGDGQQEHDEQVPKVTPSKRRGSPAYLKKFPAKKIKGARNRNLSGQPLNDPITPATPEPVTLDAVSLAISDRTPNLKNWDEATKNGQMQLKGTRRFEIKKVRTLEEARKSAPWRKEAMKSDMPVRNLQDGDVYDKRRFSVVDAVSQQVSRTDGKTTLESLSVWAIHVRDENRENAPKLLLYGESPPGLRQARHGGAIDFVICPTKDDALNLGKCACHLLNRFPSSLQESVWDQLNLSPKGGEQYAAYARHVVETLALTYWQPGFDPMRLYEPYRRRQPPGLLSFNTNNPRLNTTKKGVMKMVPILCDGVKFAGLLGNDALNVYLNFDHLNTDAIEKISPLPANFVHQTAVIDFKGKQIPEQTRKLAFKLMNYIEYHLLGKTGGYKHLHNYLNELQRPYTSQGLRGPQLHAPSMGGPYGGFPIWMKSREAGGVRVYPSTAVISDTTIPVPSILILTSSKLQVAFVLNSILAPLNSGKNIIEAWQAGCVAADEVRLSLASQDAIIEAQCLCSSDSQKQGTSHICAFCWDIRRCKDLVHADDGRLLCASHGDSIELQQDSLPPRSFVSWIGNKVSRLTEQSLDAFLKQDMRGVLSKYVTVTDGNEDAWVDAYDGTRPRQALQRRNRHGRAAIHPLSPSLEAVVTLVMVDGKLYYHHPSNIVLTLDFVNRLKGRSPPSIVAITREAARRTISEQKGEIERDPAAWRRINNSFDHVHLLTNLTCHSKKSRLSTPISPKALAMLQQAWKRGHWDASLYATANQGSRRIPLTAGEAGELDYYAYTEGRKDHIGGFDGHPRFQAAFSALDADALEEIRKRSEMWSDEDISNLVTLIKQIESSDIYNPKHLDMPRVGNAPWPFRKDHMFAKDRKLWPWLFLEMVVRYHRMIYECDWEHDTQESPATLLLLLIIQWFATGGGIDPYIHCEMTIWRNHAQRFSFGRAGHVEPGSPMATGFSIPMPTDIELHYNEGKRTIQAQPWFVNAMWHNYDIGLHATIRVVLAGIAAETAYYDAFNPDRPPIPYPKESAVSRRLRQATAAEPRVWAGGATASQDESDAASDVEEEDYEPILEGDDIAHDPSPGDAAEAAATEAQRSATCQTLLKQLEGFVIEVDRAAITSEHRNNLALELSDMVNTAETGQRAAFTEAEHKAKARLNRLVEENRPCQVCNEIPSLQDRATCAGEHQPDFVMHLACATLQLSPDGELLCARCSLLPKNMPNIGSTCFMSSSIQILGSLQPFVNTLKDTKFKFKATQESGRSVREWLTGSYDVKADTSRRTVLEWDREHMRNAQTLAKQLKNVLQYLMEQVTAKVTRTQMSEFAADVRRYDKKEYIIDKPNDSISLLITLLDCLTLVTDDSTTSGRGAQTRVTEAREQAIKENKPILPLQHDSVDSYAAWASEGRSSPFVGLFSVQFTTEAECRKCAAISRNIEQSRTLSLAWPETPPTTGDFTLKNLLDNWAVEHLSEGVFCPRLPKDDPPMTPRFRKITQLPPLLIISFNRWSPDDQLKRMDHIDIPEFLDLYPYAGGTKLPSEKGSDSSVGHDQDAIYRLVAVNVFLPSIEHYVCFVVHENEWIRLDDVHHPGGVTPRHPQAAINDGHVPYYVVYQREKGRKTLPLDSDHQPTRGFVLSRGARTPDSRVEAVAYPSYQCPWEGCTSMFTIQAEADEHALTHRDDDDGTNVEPMGDEFAVTDGDMDTTSGPQPQPDEPALPGGEKDAAAAVEHRDHEDVRDGGEKATGTTAEKDTLMKDITDDGVTAQSPGGESAILPGDMAGQLQALKAMTEECRQAVTAAEQAAAKVSQQRHQLVQAEREAQLAHEARKAESEKQMEGFLMRMKHVVDAFVQAGTQAGQSIDEELANFRK